MKLAVDFSQLAAFDAIPAYIAFLTSGDPDELAGLDFLNAITTFFGTAGVFGTGGIDALLPDDAAESPQPGYAALSALAVFFGSEGVFGTGGVDALADYDALSAIPVFQAIANAATPQEAIDALGDYDALSAVPVFVGTDGVFTGGGVNALGGYGALSAVDTFFGDNNGDTNGGVFTGGGINALAPDADGNGGYAALSALPVFLGTDPVTGDGTGVLNGGGVEALSGYDALSAIPAYLAPTPPLTLTATTSEPAALRTTSTSALPGGGAGTQSAPSFAPQAITLPQLPKVELPKLDPAVTPGPKLNVSRVSEKFTPGSIGKSPILFGTGTPVSTTVCPAGKRASRSWASVAARMPAATPAAHRSHLLQRIGRARFEPARFCV